MSSRFELIIERASTLGPVGVSVVEAADEATLSALSTAERLGFAVPFLIGDRAKIEKTLEEHGIQLRTAEFVQTQSPEESCDRGIALVREGRCKILVKGKIQTPVLLKHVLDREKGLRTGKILSHVACLEVPGYDRFIFVTDGGVTLNPDLEKKVAIVRNAIEVAKLMGVEFPRIALLGPSEMVTPDSTASVHAATISEMARQGEFPGAFVEGPMALDVAVSAESARIKGVTGEVSGRADVLLAPDVVCGNSIAKSMQYFAGAVMGGVIVGALVPIVVISRADTSEVKLNSLAMARCLVS